MFSETGVEPDDGEICNTVFHNDAISLKLSSVSFGLLKRDLFLVLDLSTVAKMFEHDATSYKPSSCHGRLKNHVMKKTFFTETSPFILKDVNSGF